MPHSVLDNEHSLIVNMLESEIDVTTFLLGAQRNVTKWYIKFKKINENHL